MPIPQNRTLVVELLELVMVDFTHKLGKCLFLKMREKSRLILLEVSLVSALVGGCWVYQESIKKGKFLLLVIMIIVLIILMIHSKHLQLPLSNHGRVQMEQIKIGMLIFVLLDMMIYYMFINLVQELKEE